MGQRLFIKISRRESLQCKPSHPELVEPYGGDALSYSEVCYWRRQFLMGRKCDEERKKD
jgi:hypothetical protein